MGLPRALRPAASAAIRGVASVQLTRQGAPDLRRAVRSSNGRVPSGDLDRLTAIEERRRHLEAFAEPLGTSTVGEVTRQTSRLPRWGLFLYRLVQETGAATVLEMGTSVGISGLYIAAALDSRRGGRLVTLEGNPDRAAIATEGFRSLGFGDTAEVRVGTFAERLEGAVAALGRLDLVFIDGHHKEKPTLEYFDTISGHLTPGAVVVFDDIRWSAGMKRAWATVKSNDGVTAWADLHQLGLIRWGRRPQ